MLMASGWSPSHSQPPLTRLRAEAALGALDAEARPEKSNQHTAAATPTVAAPVLNVAPTTRANWRKLGALDDEKLDQVIEEVKATDDTISTAAGSVGEPTYV